MRSRLPLQAIRSARMVFRSEDGAAGSGSPILSDVEIHLAGELEFRIAKRSYGECITCVQHGMRKSGSTVMN
jgi:hypothetical protein